MVLSLCAIGTTVRAAGPLPTISIRLADEIIGDGSTPVRCSVVVAPKRSAKKLRQVEISADAGCVRITKTAPAGYYCEFVPPFVAARTKVTLRFSGKLGAKKIVRSTTVRVKPPANTTEPIQTDGPLDLRITPGALVMGRDLSAMVMVRTPQGRAPRLLTNVGKFSAVERLDDGWFRAKLWPKGPQYPQVAIVAALTPTGSFDWAAVPLVGQGVVTTKADPGLRVQVNVAGRSFGPFLADRKGKVKVPFVAPPGVASGSKVLRDRAGHSRVSEINLGVPSFNRILAACDGSRDRVLVFAVNDSGEPLPGASLKLTTKLGGLTPPRMTEAGVYESRFTPAPKARVGQQAAIRVIEVGHRTSKSRCSLSIQGGPPATAEVQVEPGQYVAGTGTVVGVNITLRDVSGRPPRETPVDLDADLGKITEVSPAGPARFRATWQLPDEFAGKQRAVLVVRTGSQEAAVTAEASVVLKAAKVASINIAAQDDILSGDGESSTRITVAPVDQYGNPAAEAVLVAAAEGKVSEVFDQDHDGTFDATYTAPVRYQTGFDTVVVREEGSGVSAELSLDLLPRKRAMSFTVKGGYGTNFGAVSAPAMMVDVAVRLPLLNRALQLGIDAGFSKHRLNRGIEGLDERVKVSVWTVPILLRAVYQLPLSNWLGFYVGACGGAYIVGSKIKSQSLRPEAAVRAHPAFGGLAGVDVPLGPGRVTLEAIYARVDVSDQVLRGNVGGLLGLVGYRIDT